jgi:hypothetical protein
VIERWQAQIAIWLESAKRILIMTLGLEANHHTNPLLDQLPPIPCINKAADNQLGCNRSRIWWKGGLP